MAVPTKNGCGCGRSSASPGCPGLSAAVLQSGHVMRSACCLVDRRGSVPHRVLRHPAMCSMSQGGHRTSQQKGSASKDGVLQETSPVRWTAVRVCLHSGERFR